MTLDFLPNPKEPQNRRALRCAIGLISLSILHSIVLLTGCQYHLERNQSQESPITLVIPYIKGDVDGRLNNELVQMVSQSKLFECVQNSGERILEVGIIGESDDRIGYRFDRNPTSGKLRKNIVGTENRHVVVAEVKLFDAQTHEVLAGPQILKGYSEYDYVDSNSVRDLTFINSRGEFEYTLDFSLGQLDSIEGAHDDSLTVAFRDLAQKIVDGLSFTASSRSRK